MIILHTSRDPSSSSECSLISISSPILQFRLGQPCSQSPNVLLLVCYLSALVFICLSQALSYPSGLQLKIYSPLAHFFLDSTRLSYMYLHITLISSIDNSNRLNSYVTISHSQVHSTVFSNKVVMRLCLKYHCIRRHPRKQKQEDCHEFKGSLIFIVN